MENGPPELPDMIKIAMTLGAALITAIGGWLVAVSPKFGTKKQTQIDELRKDVASLRAYTQELKEDVVELDSTVNKQRQAINKMIARDYAWQRRNWTLEQQILEGRPAPFPQLEPILTATITIED